MNSYLVLKMTSKGVRSQSGAVVISLDKNSSGRKKSIHVTGNIPELYHGMVIDLDVDENGFVRDYSLVLGEANKKALEKNGVCVEEYQAILERHKVLKEDGVGWKYATMSLDEIYNALPFGEADKLHKEMVNNAKEPIRIDAINKRIIENARRKRKIAYKIEEYLGYFDDVEKEGAYQQLMVSLKVLCLQASQYGFSGGTVWDNEMKTKEDFIKDNIQKRKSIEHSILTADEIQKFSFSVRNNGLEEEQIDTVWGLMDSVPCIITGGAGVGKTTVIQTLIDCYSMYYPKSDILLCAPTGKASRRLAEKTRLPASTIHKALRKTPEDSFVYYNEDNPLPHNLIIVDEASMIDTSLMYDLLCAVPLTSKIIFVGDHNQLYPVGYGEPFFDFLSELDVFSLRINHRQAEGTDILKNANRILEGKPIFSGAGVAVEHITYEDIGSILLTLGGDTQIITPYNNLNSQINYYLKKGEDRFNIGDKVMTIKNTKYYCNGDIGIVKTIDKKDNIIIDIDGREVTVAKSHYDDLMLAYSITVHKMQGSEAERVVVFIPENDSLITKRLLYTAVTRAKSELVLYYFSY